MIGELAKKCGRLVNACDAGREGQLIFHLIRRYLKLRQPADRLWISDLTPETIRKGFDQLSSDEKYDPLTRAAQARSEADWLIGMNASRAFTIRHRALLSVGGFGRPSWRCYTIVIWRFRRSSRRRFTSFRLYLTRTASSTAAYGKETA